MRKKFIILASFIWVNAWGAQGHKVEILGRIHVSNHVVQFYGLKDKYAIPSVLKDQALEKIILKMKHGEEAIVKGHIAHHATIPIEGETRFTPVLVIESITPITLNMLGADEAYQVQPSQNYSLERAKESKLIIPVTIEVASAITLTSTLLLMQSLTMANGPGVVQDINTATFLFAGAMATGLFIYEQIKGHKL